MKQSPCESNSHSACQEIPHFYGNRRLITVFTRAQHWSLFWARQIQSTPFHPISIKSILILSFHLRLGFLSSFFTTDFRTPFIKGREFFDYLSDCQIVRKVSTPRVSSVTCFPIPVFCHLEFNNSAPKCRLTFALIANRSVSGEQKACNMTALIVRHVLRTTSALMFLCCGGGSQPVRVCIMKGQR